MKLRLHLNFITLHPSSALCAWLFASFLSLSAFWAESRETKRRKTFSCMLLSGSTASDVIQKSFPRARTKCQSSSIFSVYHNFFEIIWCVTAATGLITKSCDTFDKNTHQWWTSRNSRQHNARSSNYWSSGPKFSTRVHISLVIDSIINTLGVNSV